MKPWPRRSSNTAGTIVRGIETTSIGSVIDLVQNIEVGKFEYLDEPAKLADLPADEVIGISTGGEIFLKGPRVKSWLKQDLDDDVSAATEPVYPGIVVGRELAKTLHVYVGDEVTLVAPLGDLGPMGVLPRSRKFRVAAIFYSGMYEYDSSHLYMKRDDAQEFLDLRGKTTAVEVKLDDAELVGAVRPELEALVKRHATASGSRGHEDPRLEGAEQEPVLGAQARKDRDLHHPEHRHRGGELLHHLHAAPDGHREEQRDRDHEGPGRQRSRHLAHLHGRGRHHRRHRHRVRGRHRACAPCWGSCGSACASIRTCTTSIACPSPWTQSTTLLVALSAMVITTIATIYPAIAASRLRPVDGIRYE